MGNTNIVIGCIDDKQTYFVERVTTSHDKTGTEYAINIKNILEIHHIEPSQIEGAILSSVVPPLNAIISSAVKKILGYHPMLVGAGIKTGMNMGTATTLSVVDHSGNYIGGVILPGLRVSLDSLSSKTAQLPSISLDIPKSVIGKNTIDCMRSGIMYGNAGMIDGILDRMEEELGTTPSVVATGGLSRFVVPLCRHKIIYDDALLLKGLLILYEKNNTAKENA